MEYRTHKGMTVSEIGVGCYGLSGAYGVKESEKYVDVLRAGYDLGVTFFDTAEAYGEAERVLGEAVASFREDIRIATKVGVREELNPNLSASYVTKACERSLSQLGTDYIDLYQVHFDDPDTPIAETVGALEDLQRSGKILHYGLGHLPATRVEEYFRCAEPFSVLIELSAVARDGLRSIVPLCTAADVGVIGFSVTGRGALTGKVTADTRFLEGDIRRIDPLFQRERLGSALRVADLLTDVAREYGKTPVQVAISWVLSRPSMLCALTGPSSVDHLQENIAASGFVLDEEHLRRIDEFLAGEDERLPKEMAKATREILAKRDLAECASAVEDLVYAAEAAHQLGWVEEKDLIPVVRDLLPLRKKARGLQVNEALRDIQARLAAAIEPSS